MSRPREISAVYEVKQSDDNGALDCLLSIIEKVINTEATLEEKEYNDI